MNDTLIGDAKAFLEVASRDGAVFPMDTVCGLVARLLLAVETMGRHINDLRVQTDIAEAIDGLNNSLNAELSEKDSELDMVYALLGSAAFALKPFAELSLQHGVGNSHPLTDLAPLGILPHVAAGPSTVLHLGDCRRAAEVFNNCVGSITLYNLEMANAHTETAGGDDIEADEGGEEAH